MKRSVAIFIAIAILLQSFNKVLIYFSFKVNQEYIARALCINRNRPEMHCDGKCILMQRIRAEEEQEKRDIPVKLKEQKDAVYWFRPETLVFIAEEPAISHQKPFLPYHFSLKKGVPQRIFHPPPGSV